MNTIELMLEALIARLRMMQSALGVDGTCGEAADALERMVAELADVTSMYNRCVDDVHAARVERDSLKEGLDGWHARYLDCEVERDALRADAMRYRWLRRVERGLRGWNVMHYAKCYTAETLDEVIDVAIGEKT